MHSYVVEGEGKRITDLLSYYTLPSTVIGNDQYDSLQARAMHPRCWCRQPVAPLTSQRAPSASRAPHPTTPPTSPPPSTPLPPSRQPTCSTPCRAQLLHDALILAHGSGHDVFNALDILENGSVLKGTRGRVCVLRRCAARPRTVLQRAPLAMPRRPQIWHRRRQAAVLFVQLARGCRGAGQPGCAGHAVRGAPQAPGRRVIATWACDTLTCSSSSTVRTARSLQ